MRALLLAAGLGTRLRPITNTIPKCLVPICGKPLMEYWLDLLFGNDAVDRVLINTHYFPEAVRNFVDQSRWRDRIDLVFEDQLLGTGGTVLANRGWCGSDAFLVAHADNLTRFDPRAFQARHAARPKDCLITMMTFETDAPETCGIVVERDGVVTEFHEKTANPPGTRANGAVYIFEPAVLDFMASLGRSFVDISSDVLPHYLGRICTFHNGTYHRDIGNPASLALAESEFSGIGFNGMA